ncbi:fungal-specific transcription factor domain-containing protein [Annulohypoxylon maeteangense]|uniref:fungal-specific transcription factor domain-containing protein n=1 Tax=Annulohypoxylon maeteangense TaxID=1927788 RepID=UPI002007B9F3|nr:fungal-specific transcription factor domain-containing protein [Annulohypoxylon maeteangense]KAI0886680.1 fungal-specific transcription factor domain-containing protein [Annulohypoxylon maeteangense]
MGNRTKAELRTRTGCRKCRERRVKCPEERPVCRHCKRLGFTCRYEIKLSWQDVVLLEHRENVPRSLPQDLIVSIQSWMFLNTIQADYNPDSLQINSEDYQECPPTEHSDYQVPDNLTPYRYISPFQLGGAEGYLWSYFNEYMTTQIVIDPGFNPYRDIVLKMAAFSKEGPLFQCILAASANQLQSIGRNEYKQAMWFHRAKALRLLRTELAHLSSGESTGGVGGASKDQIIASTIMLTFFEISKDCSNSWTVHADFSRTFLASRLKDLGTLTAEQEALLYFAVTYFVSHDILAATGGTLMEAAEMVTEMCKAVDKSTILALTGCPRDLLILISEINQISSVIEQSGQRELSPMIQQRRNQVERFLHQLHRNVPEEFASLKSEFSVIAEVKRLAAILYLYSRVDNASPYEPKMIRVTSQILSLIPKISLRTHTGLWPLFIVATLGVRESDEDRKLILSRLAALQQTRQLASVKKARLIIEDVWKSRDLWPDKSRGWSILQGRRHGAISLA